MKVGVLAIQGDVTEHLKALEGALGVGGEAVRVKDAQTLAGADALVIPGGESTTIGKLLVKTGLIDAVKDFAREGKPVWGTCAGMILLVKEGGVEVEKTGQPLLGLMDARVSRNAFGRQRESFEAELTVKGFDRPFHGVFIRAPAIEEVSDGVEVLCEFEGRIVLARQKNLLASAFHPELSGDPRVHELFLGMVKK